MNILDEKFAIKKGILFYWDCHICKALGWDKELKCKHVKQDCNGYVYQRLRLHFEALRKAQKMR